MEDSGGGVYYYCSGETRRSQLALGIWPHGWQVTWSRQGTSMAGDKQCNGRWV